jgi:hypothetical protein
MNDKPFRHICRYGIQFDCTRCDFGDIIVVTWSLVPTYDQFARAVATMIGFHATNILPNLNGFQGYDTIRFKIPRGY